MVAFLLLGRNFTQATPFCSQEVHVLLLEDSIDRTAASGFQKQIQLKKEVNLTNLSLKAAPLSLAV